MTIKEMQDKRAGLVVQMRLLLDKAGAEKRDLNADEQTNYSNLEREVDSLKARIEREDRLSTVENALRETRDGSYRASVATEGDKRARKVDSPEYRNALFDRYARLGNNGLLPQFVNALQVGTSSEGGYIVPTEFETRLVEIMTNLDPIRARANVISTASDRNIPVETSKGTFAYIAEEAAYSVASDPAFGQVVLSAFKSGGIIKVSEELLQDAFFDLEAYLLRNAAERFNTLEETNFANGDGSSKPKGIFATASVAGVSVASTTSASATTITADNLVDCFHALERPYRNNAIWLMNDSTVKLLRKIKTGISGDTTYVWQPGMQAGQPDTLFGRPVFTTGGAPAATTGLVSVALVDPSKYYIADRLGTTVQRLNELYAANGQVGFKFMRRNDGRLVDAKALSIITQA